MAWLIAIVALLIVYFLACDMAYKIACDRKADLTRLPRPGQDAGFSPWKEYMPLIKEKQAWFGAQSPERVTATSFDGLTLVANYLPAKDSDKTILLAHGYRSGEATFDFSCAFEPYHNMGYNLLLIDQRAHGESGGRYIGFGVPERRDILTWTEFLNERYRPRAIVIDGMSMGAATVLMALELNLPPNVVGAVADCGYTSPKAIIAHVLKSTTGVSAAPFWPGIELVAKLRSGYFLSGASASEALKRARIPVLFIHGEDDRYVPAEMGKENYAACASAKQLLIVPGAGHGMSFLIDPDGCTQALTQFLRGVFAEK